jgi:hypothetical protein
MRPIPPYRQLPLPLVLPDPRLAAARAALAAADRANTAAARRRSNDALAKHLVDLAAARGRPEGKPGSPTS